MPPNDFKLFSFRFQTENGHGNSHSNEKSALKINNSECLLLGKNDKVSKSVSGLEGVRDRLTDFFFFFF